MDGELGNILGFSIPFFVLLGLNIRDYIERYKSAALKVKAIYIYPVKGGRSIKVDSCVLTKFGLEYDREWMVVKQQTASDTNASDVHPSFITQRQIPALALLQVNIDRQKGIVSLQHPHNETCHLLPLHVSISDSDRKITVRVWSSVCEAIDCGDEAAQWISETLKTENLRIVRKSNEHKRNLSNATLKEFKAAGGIIEEAEGPQIAFPDDNPILIATESSLQELSRRAGEDVPMDRFRPNLVIGGSSFPFAEDHWDQLKVGNIHLISMGRKARCKVTTIDQNRGEVSKPDPLAVLRTFREENNELFFGQNYGYQDSEIGSALAVGSYITVITKPSSK